MSADVRAALAELVARAEQNALVKPVWDPKSILSPAQLQIFSDTAKTVGVTAGRRFGKSHVAGVKGIDVCLSTPNINAVYIAATRESARRMVWSSVLDLNREYELGGVPNATRLTLTFSNGSVFQIIPCDSRKAADRLRGIKNLHWVCVDETQLFSRGDDVLGYLLRDVLRAGMLDALAKAQIWLMGTPNPLGKTGAFWERWSNPKTSRHTGTIYDNTKKFPTPAAVEAAINEILEEEQQTKDSAWYRTEILAEWGVVDTDKRVYKFSDERNLWHYPSSHPRPANDNTPFVPCPNCLPDDLCYAAIGVDIGSTAADACAVVRWRDDDDRVFLVEERVERGQDDVALGLMLAELSAMYDPIQIVADAGGGGAKSVLTLQHLHPELPIIPADKPPIPVQVNVLNGLLKTGRFLVPSSSTFASEVRQASWVDGIVNGKISEGDAHSDVLPACRYAAIKIIPLLPTADTRTAEEKQAERDQQEHDLEIAKAQREGKQAKNRFYDDADDIDGSDFITKTGSFFDAA